MPLKKLEAELRPIARERIAKRQLPREASLHMWGGHGTGVLCSLCDKPIQRDEVEYEVEGHIDGPVVAFRFHVFCHSLWQLECAHEYHLKTHR
jgi:hypothetical protein